MIMIIVIIPNMYRTLLSIIVLCVVNELTHGVFKTLMEYVQ